MFIEMMNEKQRTDTVTERVRERDRESFTQIAEHTRAPTITEYRDVFKEFAEKKMNYEKQNVAN